MLNTTYTRVRLSDRYWSAAQARVKEKDEPYKLSQRGIPANQVGFLGEVVVERWFERHRIDFEDHRHSTKRDYLLAGSYSVDVKTKDRTVRPRISYDNSISMYNHSHQRPQFYLFVSLVRDKAFEKDDIRRFREACIVGGIAISSLDRVGMKRGEGEVDPSNNMEFCMDCINVPMGDLTPLRELVELWGGEPL